MDKKIDAKNARFKLVDSTLKGYKEVEVVFNHNGEDYKHFIFIDEGKNVNYINEARKQFNQDLKSGEVLKSIKPGAVNHHSWLIAGASVLGVATITFASLFTWKTLTSVNPEPGPIPPETYKFTFTGTNCSIDGSKSFTTEVEKDKENVQFTVNPDDGFQLDFYHTEGVNLEGNTLTIDKMDKDYTVNLNGIDDDIAATLEYNIVLNSQRTVSFETEGDISIDWGDGETTNATNGTNNQHDYTKTGKYEVTIRGALTSISMTDCHTVTSANIYSPLMTLIPDYSFCDCDNLTTVNLSNGVRTIGSGAFIDCISLTSINIPSSVAEILDYALSNTSLASVKFPDGITSIDDGVLSDCVSLTSVYIPDTVKLIGNNAFYESRLSSVNIPNSVETIIGCAFYKCLSLHSIKIPNSVTFMGSGTFADSTYLSVVDLTEFKDPNKIPVLEDNIVFADCSSILQFYFANEAMKEEFAKKQYWSDLAERFTTDPVPAR